MPRIAFPIEDETFEKLKSVIPWGVQNEVYRALTDQLLETVKLLGPGVIYLIVKGQFNMITLQVKDVKEVEKSE